MGSHKHSQDGASFGTLAHSVFKNYGPPSLAFLMKWTDLTKDNLELQWPLWRSFNLPKFVSLRTKLEDQNSKIQQIEWDTYFS